MSKTDIQIAREANMKPIQEILDGVGVPDNAEAYSPISRYIAMYLLIGLYASALSGTPTPSKIS